MVEGDGAWIAGARLAQPVSLTLCHSSQAVNVNLVVHVFVFPVALRSAWLRAWADLGRYHTVNIGGAFGCRVHGGAMAR